MSRGFIQGAAIALGLTALGLIVGIVARILWNTLQNSC